MVFDIDSLSKEIFTLQLKRAAIKYHEQFGMNISPVFGSNVPNEGAEQVETRNNSYKKPVIEDNAELFASLKTEKQFFDYEEFDWPEATGIGVILGYNNYWALDIDNLKVPQSDYSLEAVNKISHHILNLLHLPDDYEWVVLSGSGKGLHIIFRAQSIEDDKISNDVMVFTQSRDPRDFDPDDEFLTCDNSYAPFSHIELRMRDFLVLPPSKHLSGRNYEFLNTKEPQSKPMIVSIDSLYNLFLDYFKTNDTESIRSYDRKSRGTIRRSAICFDAKESEWGGWRYSYYDELPLLKSCNSDCAINSLGFVLSKMAEEEHDIKKKKELFLLAARYFRKSCTDESRNNLHVLQSLDLLSEGPPRDIDNLGEEKYTYLRRHGYTYLFFDTETTGLPLRYDAAYEDVNNWPRLVQLSWLCVDRYGEILNSYNFYIKPEGFSIPEESEKVHGISTEYAVENGTDLETVLLEFDKFVYHAKVLVGHNIDYDINIVAAEYIRKIGYSYDSKWGGWINPAEELLRTPRICTMKSSTDYCKISGNKGFKYPRLQELYSILFGRSFDNAHDAMADVKATLECFNELRRRGIIGNQED